MSWSFQFAAKDKTKAKAQVDAYAATPGTLPPPVAEILKGQIDSVRTLTESEAILIDTNGHIDVGNVYNRLHGEAKTTVSVITLLASLFLFFAPTLVLAQAVTSAPTAPAAPSVLSTLFVQIVIPAIFTVLAAVVTWAGKSLINLIDAKAKNQTVAGILARLSATVETAVLDVNGTMKAQFAKASEDGVITPGEAAQLKAAAIAKIKEHLGPKGIGELTTVLGVNGSLLDSFIGSHIEAAIEGSKPAAPSVKDTALAAAVGALNVGITAMAAPRIDPAVSSVDLIEIPVTAPPAAPTTPAVAPVP